MAKAISLLLVSSLYNPTIFDTDLLCLHVTLYILHLPQIAFYIITLCFVLFLYNHGCYFPTLFPTYFS